MSVIYEKPIDLSDVLSVANGELLPVVGGPMDGTSLPVPLMFDAIAPAFMRFGWHVYQLNWVRRQWRFIHSIGQSWAAREKSCAPPAGARAAEGEE